MDDGCHVLEYVVAAEYLAHGYVLGDNVIQQSIALDSTYTISIPFVLSARLIYSRSMIREAWHLKAFHFLL
jgi:hypothetical protein